MSFQTVLEKYRAAAFSKRNLGDRFERLMQAFLLTYQLYDGSFQEVWLWHDFPYRSEFNDKGQDIGIDLVCKTFGNEYWAVQCKCYREDTLISKENVDSFLSASGKHFPAETGDFVGFSHRLWISTTNNWSSNAKASLQHQVPEVYRLTLNDLASARVDWDKLDEGISGVAAQFEKFELRNYQKDALDAVHTHFLEHDRGKLIMACGTGKTFLSLKIAEHETANRGLILVLVPSIALVGQTLRTWCEQCEVSIHPICICSDSSVSLKKCNSSDDSSDVSVIDLALPASTDRDTIAHRLSEAQQSTEGMTVVFSTYQSIDVISDVQKSLGFVFDLIICDEAHRTTGATFSNASESSFVKVHYNKFLQSKKRLYMTATPRLYRDSTKKKAELHDTVLCSMDDESLYGREIYHLSFSDAVELELLSDYKVLILTYTGFALPPSILARIQDPSDPLAIDDAVKIIGCIKALSKQISEGPLPDSQALPLDQDDPHPMKRAVAFCQSIKISKQITTYFNEISAKYREDLEKDPGLSPVSFKNVVAVESHHVDGTMGSSDRDKELQWLQTDSSLNAAVGPTCRILTNVRCLSEGVDVPSLDAVMFLSAKTSDIDIIQSVGRVMRKSPGKKFGYVILPLVFSEHQDPVKQLNENPQNYQLIWDVLNALRSHDERLTREIEHLKFQDPPGGPRGNGGENDSPVSRGGMTGKHIIIGGWQIDLSHFLEGNALRGALYAKMVEKVGDRDYLGVWARRVAQIAVKVEDRLRFLLHNPRVSDDFHEFVRSLQKNLNPNVDVNQAVEMLTQHMLTKPIFEALFEDYSFISENLISQSMQKMIAILEANAFEKETESLVPFYQRIQQRIQGYPPEGRQEVIRKLYSDFFTTAFPKMASQIGIAYTPITIVDFILQSVNDVLKEEFDRTLSDEGVHILDPFAGTGSFLVRMFEMNLLREEDLARKYSHEIHANEIALLPYYITAINIENAYFAKMPAGTQYHSCPGICLADTFQMMEWDEEKEGKEHLDRSQFPLTSEQITKQKKTPITVIVGNPPYSAGQRSANDNAQNLSYPKLEERIAKTYVRDSATTNKNSLYDSYIKAFRWATDRLDKNGGIIGFITNGGWIDGNAMDGFRKHLAKEFSSIYVFNLRGNQRTSGELLKKEGERIFNGIRVSPAITLLVRNPSRHAKKATIQYHDIGDYLSQEQKLERIKAFGSVCNQEMNWEPIHPNEEGDWINQRNPVFSTYPPIGDKKGEEADAAWFTPIYSRGLETARDAWCYNSSKSHLAEKIQESIAFYNSQVEEYATAKKANPKLEAEDFVTYDSTKFSWSDKAKIAISKFKKYSFNNSAIRESIYRPFFKQISYVENDLSNRAGQILQIFPPAAENRVICVSGIGVTKEFTTLMVDCIPDLGLVGASQCFPLYSYDSLAARKEKDPAASQTSLFTSYDSSSEITYQRKDGISDFIHAKAKAQYHTADITKEDLFYYVYGILHSPTYRETFSADLKKMLPRIPLVSSYDDFIAFNQAGRELADLHLHYETVEPYADAVVTGTDSGNFRVTKMRFPQKGQKDTILYNTAITVSNIPEKAYRYTLGGVSAIEWIMDRYQVTIDKDSGIKNDPNDWAEEKGEPRYILDLLLRIITVSLRTVDIVDRLPDLVFRA